MYIFLIIIVAFILIRLGEFLSLFARMMYLKKDATEKQRERALKLYKFAMKVGGCSVITKVNYAYLALRHGHIDDAETVLRKVLSVAKKHHDIVAAKSTLALVCWKRDELDEAIELLEAVVESGPNATAYGSLGHMYNLNGDYEKALEFNKNAMEYAPEDNIIMDNYATSLYKTGDVAKAKEVYKELIERKPTFPEAYVSYAQILAESGDKGEAKAMLKKALKANYTFLTTLTKEEIEEKIQSL